MYVNPDDASFKDIIGKYPFLQKYTSPMKKMERELVGRSQEMRSLKAAFNRAELSNVLLLAEAGSGKAIDDDEMLPVNDGRGYIRMGDVAVGDQVFDEEGTATPVVGVFPQGKKRAYRVTFFDGTSVVCNDEHIWRVEDVASHFRKSPKYFDYTLAELMHHGLFDESTGASLWYVPVCNALQRGVYLDAVRDDAEHYGAAVGRTLSMDVKAGYPMDESDFKAFLYADLSLRQLFLDSVLKQLPVHVHPYTGTITVGVGDGELAQQLREMWTSVGTRSVVDGELLRLYPSLRSMGIAKVEDLGEEREMTCIYVASPLHTFVVGRDHIVTHNTALVQGTMEKDDKRIYLEVDLSRMIADLTNVDEISDKLKRLFSEASEFGKDERFEVVLFMDEFHQVVQISAVAVEALKPLLADSATRGIHVVAATTYVEFMKHISSNQPLVERLQRINLPEVDRDTTVSILHGMAKRYGVSGKIADEGLYGLIYEYTNRYIPANAQPRKSILVLDSMIGWHRSEGRNMDLKLLADVIYESEGVNVAFRVDPTTIKERIDERVYAQDYATASIAQRLQLCVADLNDKSKTMSNFLFCGSTGVGKLISNKTPVPVMPSGEGGVKFKSHGDLVPGDVVFDRCGNPTKVLSVHPHEGVKMYRVMLSDGRTLDVGADHLWTVYTAKQRHKVQNEGRDDIEPYVMSTQEIYDRGVVRAYPGSSRQHAKYFIPMNGAVRWPEANLPVDPYVLGAFIGNGCLTSNALKLSSNDVEVVDAVAAAIGADGYKKDSGSYSWSFLLPDDLVPRTKSGEKTKCRKYFSTEDVFGGVPEIVGVKSAERGIPEQFMTASVEQRMALVHGLFDTDGSVSKDDRCRVSYSTFSRQLADDVVQLLFSLGISSKWTVSTRTREDDGGKVRKLVEYTVRVRCAPNVKPTLFTLERKVERAERAARIAATSRTRVKKFDMVAMMDIEPIGTQDAQCIYVDNDEHLYQAGQFVVTHNTEVVKQMAGILFGDAQRHLHRLDMSEYANPDSLERFRLELTTMVWERPYCIILLDEIEKACGEIVRLLLSVLDDARLTDRNGRVVSFNNAYVVMTTNAGSEIFKTIAQYEASDTGSGEFLVRYDKLIRKSLMSAVGSNRFPPELLGRVNCIVPFQPLSEATMRRIVENKLFELKRELFRKHRVEMKVSSKVIDYLVLDSLDTDSDSGGARSVISKLESEVTTAVARYVNANPDVHEIGVKVEGEMAFENKQRAISEAYIKVVGVREARSG